MSEIVELLDYVVQRGSVTAKPGAVGTKSGFGSRPPIDLDALDLRDRLTAAETWARWDLDDATEAAMARIERPAHVPLGLCPECDTPVWCEFDRVAAQCPLCGGWLNRADSVAAAREYVEQTWLTAAEIEEETRTWGSPVKAARVRQWRRRGRIEADEDSRYRLADVLAVLDEIDRHLSAA
ncbi:hypothetical protein ATK30_6840 [Amycolatopsis echigonensis]|uniref:Uncharacterized protein n=1 Tax=Amycolatopsis echigonensis TaxID=2576905 RepID=A0A2N3WPV6_9PSEU|nr:hypothetical protein [Amycolatopsis niigatensis]PKV95907.1 hypothetical protein ATK30_6840 [Amycolatopsis niigatensis]